MELYATYNNADVLFSRLEGDKGAKFCEARLRLRQKYDICPFCKKELKEELKNGTVLLLLNNWKLFPNAIVHESCCNEFPSKEEAIKHLHEDYKIAVTHKHWLNVD